MTLNERLMMAGNELGAIATRYGRQLVAQNTSTVTELVRNARASWTILESAGREIGGVVKQAQSGSAATAKAAPKATRKTAKPRTRKAA
jgi:ribosomal protein L12E/L44/L45/RPP1/RPP2